MHFTATGPEDAPRIVFVHGAGVAGWMWDLQVADLSAEYRCLVPVLPGHHPDSADEAFSIATSVAQLATLIEDQGGKAHLVGLSLGASIVIALLAQHPQRIGRAMISAPAVGPLPPMLRLASKLGSGLVSRDFVIRRTATSLGIPDEHYESFRALQKRLAGPLFKQIDQDIEQFRIPAALGEVDVPTLAMVGEKEFDLNRRAALQVAQQMPAGVGRVAPSGNHGWNAQLPELFNQTLRAWLAEQELPAALLPLNPR